LYGGGPPASPQLYDPEDRAKLRLESGGLFEDLPREEGGRAVVADPRNDENLMVCGLQCAFICFHNNVVDLVREEGDTLPQFVFAEARRRVLDHYQWIVVHEFLPQIVGRDVLHDVRRRGRRYFRPEAGATMPVEFQGAAYRFGHSMVRPSYRANLAGDDGEAFFGMVFDPAGEGRDDPEDLRGGCRAPRRFIGWQTFFDFGDGEVRPNKRIDTKLSTPLFDLPLGAIASGDPPTSLAQRNLLRQVTWSLPSGQSVAREMRTAPVPPSDMPELARYGIGLESSTPLWYYVLKEAEVRADGLTLGPVGGRIVAEVLLGILEMDPNAYVHRRRWRPTLPQRDGRVTGEFTIVDLLTFAGVDPASRGQ
ncbi:MAG TPA: peroxidase family protein, partial [Acidimicrobiales bacterium]